MLLVYDVDDNVVATQTITHGTEAKTVLVNEFKDVVKVVLRKTMIVLRYYILMHRIVLSRMAVTNIKIALQCCRSGKYREF